MTTLEEHHEPGTVENHEQELATKTQDLSLADHEVDGEAIPNGDATHEHDAEDDGDDGDDRHINGDATSVHTARSRPNVEEPSRSYVKPIPIVTTYEPDIPETTSVKHRSVAGSVKAPTQRGTSMRANSVRAPTKAETIRSPSRAASVRPTSIRKAESVRSLGPPASVKPSVRGSQRYSHLAEGAIGGAAVGEVVSSERQRELQQAGEQNHRGVALTDNGPIMGNHRPTSPFGYRPQPNIMSVTEDGRESRFDGRDSRQGLVNRSGTVVSRANTVGRSGTLSRAANGGTVGGRRGAFGRGAGASIGTQPEEVLGRDDIHTRAELSERILDDQTLRRLSTMERKDAKRLSRVIKNEGKAEAMAVKGSIKELERLSKLQREAAAAERHSQQRLAKWTTKEHKARLRFLKEKERYERIEGDLRNAENDYEERRDHAAGLTAQVAEKTQELDDLRGQKAADDRERAVKLLALKNPAHS
ncbi:hypothetical protein BD324DRAFT_607087 [Kockovaella imperatae]|uniref:DNA binding protein Ncp1 n=1 Tax=Kockovaella imperatae TaxID=4999 RepID=A0A1Y1UPE8_9TREE|nr:hypothetical protein BD324DRAFT_607087 [Kockovaella imperatae]ORX39918.1 hypothetical protein BD324DRAFT_607087 [Kockovaella imperatae]